MNTDRVLSIATIYSGAIAAATGGQPSGHLYALLGMGLGASLDEHNAAVTALSNAGLVDEKNHLVTWTGPDDLRHELVAAMEN